MSKWRTDEPPKNGCFLADVGLPWPVVAVWNGVGDGYVYAELNCSIGADGWNDTYFETEGYCEVKRWMSLPELPKGDA